MTKKAVFLRETAFILYDGMARTIVITSGKGGVGKTTCAANLGRALSKRKRLVVLMEGDVGLNNLDAALGVEDKIVYEMGEVAAGKASVEQCLLPVEENLWLLPATTASAGLLSADFFVSVAEKLRATYDYVLIDCPAGLEEGFHRAVSAAKEAIVVTTPHITGIRDGYKTARALASYGIDRVGLIVNRVRGEYVVKGDMIAPEEIAKTMRLPLYGVVPEDDDVNLGLLPDIEEKRMGAGFGYALIAAYIDGDERKIYDCTAPYRGLKNRFLRWLG